jgi:hypothetical protein
MRCISLLVAGAALASCTTAPPAPVMRSAGAQATYERLLAGKVAGPSVSCIPAFNSNDMRTIDAQTLAFRVGGATTYVARLSPGCEQLGRGTYTLLTRQYGGGGLCRGQIAQVVDPLNGIGVGSCVIEDVTPFRRAS